MFISLKRRILLLNMVLISVVMLSAFVAVYVTTWRGIRAENLRRLESNVVSAVSYSSESIDVVVDIAPEAQWELMSAEIYEMESKRTLRNLLLTLSVVGAAVLVVFYFISLYFSKRAVKPLLEAWEKQKRFIADASHELKTPLTIISANCDALVESEGESPEERRKWIDYIQAGANRMSKLTRQLLELARMDDISLALTLTDVNVSEIALALVRSMEAVRHTLKLTHNIEPNVTIKSDGESIAAVFAALLDNAVKYADSRVDVTLAKEKRRVCFSVSNDGAGIRDLSKVFDRFYRGDTARGGNESYGLGLSIAKTAVESLGGRISVQSEVGGDTVFMVSFGVFG